MKININGVDRTASPEEVAEIKMIVSTAYDGEKEAAERAAAKALIADKLGLSAEELTALLS